MCRWLKVGVIEPLPMHIVKPKDIHFNFHIKDSWFFISNFHCQSRALVLSTSSFAPWTEAAVEGVFSKCQRAWKQRLSDWVLNKIFISFRHWKCLNLSIWLRSLTKVNVEDVSLESRVNGTAFRSTCRNLFLSQNRYIFSQHLIIPIECDGWRTRGTARQGIVRQRDIELKYLSPTRLHH